MRKAAERVRTWRPLTALTAGKKQHFFGYYDKCPWNASGRYVLAHEVDIPSRMLTAEDAATVGVIDLENDCRYEAVGQTRAWHWQQGAMLQWWPGEPERTIVYNVRVGDNFGCVVQDIASGNTRRLPLPVAALSHDGRIGLSLNFSRLAVERPGYGYEGLPDPAGDACAPDSDGIYRFDLTTGERELIVPLAAVAAYRSDETMAGVKHWFNHLMFTPDDRRFVFLHRWRRIKHAPDGSPVPDWHYTRMFTANIDGSDLHCLNDHDMTSHFDWRDSRFLLAFAKRFGTGDQYYLFRDRFDRVEVVGETSLTALYDGHCTYSPDREWILTDTYPDVAGMRRLLVYSPKLDLRIDLGQFYSEESWPAPCRCDLHPRWSRTGSQVCIDSSHEGNRQVYVMDLESIVT